MRALFRYTRLGFLEKVFKDGLLRKRVGDLHCRNLVLCLDYSPAFATQPGGARLERVLRPGIE